MAADLFGTAGRRRQHQLGRHREHLPRGADRPRPRPRRARHRRAQHRHRRRPRTRRSPRRASTSTSSRSWCRWAPTAGPTSPPMAAACDDAHRARRRLGALLPVRRHRPHHRPRRRWPLERGVLCHVDACLGGWLLPFWERLGEPVPPWDFRSPGVTSISADVHKYGYTFKGASTVLYRDRDLLQRQFFLYDDWPGGLYGSSTTAGTRPAAPIAGAWAAISYLGADGYLRLAEQVRDTTRRFVDGHRRHRRPARSPRRPTCRSSSSAPTRSTSAPSATSWTTGAGTSTASRAGCT